MKKEGRIELPCRAIDIGYPGAQTGLVERIAENAPTLVGFDHGFSFPLH